MRQLPGNSRVGDMGDRLHFSAPRHPHDLRGLINENVESFALQKAKPGGYRRRSEIVKDESALLVGVWQTGADVALRRRFLVISIDYEQTPCFPVRSGQFMDPFRAPAGGETHICRHTAAGERLLNDRTHVGVSVSGIDDV